MGGGGTVIITSAPGPGLCHSQRFFERFFGDSLRDSLEMDLVRVSWGQGWSWKVMEGLILTLDV